MSIIKSPEDLKKLRYSCKILMSCYHLLKKKVKPGVSAGELDKFAKEYIRDYQAEPSFLGYKGFKYAVCVSIDDEIVHGTAPEKKIIPENCLVSLDMGVNYQGLFSDAALSLEVGVLDTRISKLSEDTKKSLWRGIKAVKPRAKTGDIGVAIDKIAKENGYGNIFELGGHGVGYSVHDEPFIQQTGLGGKGSTLFENQVIAIEPMFTLGSSRIVVDEEDDWTVYTSDGSISAHWEHTVLVTKKGHEVLTDIPEKELLD
jgi:methionyl aminopeptidase